AAPAGRGIPPPSGSAPARRRWRRRRRAPPSAPGCGQAGPAWARPPAPPAPGGGSSIRGGIPWSEGVVGSGGAVRPGLLVEDGAGGGCAGVRLPEGRAVGAVGVAQVAEMGARAVVGQL